MRLEPNSFAIQSSSTNLTEPRLLNLISIVLFYLLFFYIYIFYSDNLSYIRAYKRRIDRCLVVYIEITGSSWTGGQFQSAQHVITRREKKGSPLSFDSPKVTRDDDGKKKRNKKKVLMSKPQGFACNFHSPLISSLSFFFHFVLFFYIYYIVYIISCWDTIQTRLKKRNGRTD